MLVDRYQRQRFELKYRLRPERVPAVRAFLRGYLEPDPFSARRPDLWYPVYSLYLDTPDLQLCQATINGDRNRFKLRLRYYEEGPDAPVFCEIKSRLNDSIRKQRAAILRPALAPLLAGALPGAEHLVAPEGRSLTALQSFWMIAHDLGAAPRAQVSYWREAWVSRASSALRITFDRAVRCRRRCTGDLGVGPADAPPVFGEEVILEVKFTDRFPRWVGEMVRVFDLVRGGAAKYADGLAQLDGREPGVARLMPAEAGT